jgi:hypothetical protein
MPETPVVDGASTTGVTSENKHLSLLDDDDKGGRREIGGDAVWTLSTAKPGNGVEQLRYYVVLDTICNYEGLLI